MLLTVATNVSTASFSCILVTISKLTTVSESYHCADMKMESCVLYFFGPRAFPKVRSSSEEVRRQIILLVLSLSVTFLYGFKKCMTPASAEVRRTRIFITWTPKCFSLSVCSLQTWLKLVITYFLRVHEGLLKTACMTRSVSTSICTCVVKCHCIEIIPDLEKRNTFLVTYHRKQSQNS